MKWHVVLLRRFRKKVGWLLYWNSAVVQTLSLFSKIMGLTFPSSKLWGNDLVTLSKKRETISFCRFHKSTENKPAMTDNYSVSFPGVLFFIEEQEQNSIVVFQSYQGSKYMKQY